MGMPTYTVTYHLQNGQKPPKWEPRARRGVFLGISKTHSSNFPQVLHLSTGALSPQYHIVFDDVSSTELSWENLFTYSSEEKDLNEEVVDRLDHRLDVSLEDRISENRNSSVKSQYGSKPTKSGIEKSPVTGQEEPPSGHTEPPLAPEGDLPSPTPTPTPTQSSAKRTSTRIWS